MRRESECDVPPRMPKRARVRSFSLRGVLTSSCAIAIALASGVWACSVPVFRYALEHWEPDAYVLTMFHRGPLDDALREQLLALAPPSPDGRPIFNLQVNAIDISGPLSPQAEQLWRSVEATSVPHLLLQTPPTKTGPGSTVWSGPASEAALSGIMESPLRKQVSRELLEGESVVWVLLESGRAVQDEAAWSTLQTTLTKLQQTLHLTPIDPADAAELTITPEALKLSFAAHRISPTDESEAVFRELLLSVEPDLRDPSLADQPMAFPLFGRGRALYALTGEGINAATIEEACRFLTAGCQCTVKQQNPGVDLLFAVPWSRLVEPTTPLKETPPLVGLAGFGPADATATPADLSAAVSTEMQTAEPSPPPAVTPETSASPETTPVAATAEAPAAVPGGAETDAPLATSVWMILSVVLIGTLFVAMRWRNGT